MCRVQSEKTWYSGQRGCILSRYQGQNGNPGSKLAKGEITTQNAQLSDLERCFTNIDYRSIRQLAGTISVGYHSTRNGKDWDIPPALLQQGLRGFSAVQRLVVELNEAGFIVELEKRSPEICTHVSKENLPLIDLAIIGDENRLLSMIEVARKTGDPSEMSVEQISRIDNSELARILVVDPDNSTKWEDRPQLDKEQRSKRLHLLGIITKVLAGGLLTAANVGVAVLSTALPTLQTVGGEAPTVFAIATSAHVGLVGIGKGFEDLGQLLGRP